MTAAVPRSEPAHLDLLFAGSVYCDLVFAGVPMREPGAEVYAEAFKLTPGGVGNRAVAGSRLGARTALLSQLGDDPLGLHVADVSSAERDLDQVDHPTPGPRPRRTDTEPTHHTEPRWTESENPMTTEENR